MLLAPQFLSAAPHCEKILETKAATWSPSQADPNLSYGLNSFLRAYEELGLVTQETRPLIKAKKWEAVMDVMDRHELRKLTFRIQALTRIYQEFNPPFFKALRKSTEKFEKSLGEFEKARNILKASQKTKKAKLIARAQKKYDDAEGDFKKFLKKDPCLNEEGSVNDTIKALKAQEWLSPEADRAYVRGQLLSYVTRINSNIKAGKYSHDDLEEGLHELRRHLRWILVYSASLDGLISDQTNRTDLLPDYQQYVGRKEGKYGAFSAPYAERPIEIPKVIFAALTRIVDKLGNAKDIAEAQNDLSKPGKPIILKKKLDLKDLSDTIQKQIVHDRILDVFELILRSQP